MYENVLQLLKNVFNKNKMFYFITPDTLIEK